MLIAGPDYHGPPQSSSIGYTVTGRSTQDDHTTHCNNISTPRTDQTDQTDHDLDHIDQTDHDLDQTNHRIRQIRQI